MLRRDGEVRRVNGCYSPRNSLPSTEWTSRAPGLPLVSRGPPCCAGMHRAFIRSLGTLCLQAGVGGRGGSDLRWEVICSSSGTPQQEVASAQKCKGHNRTVKIHFVHAGTKGPPPSTCLERAELARWVLSPHPHRSADLLQEIMFSQTSGLLKLCIAILKNSLSPHQVPNL